MIEPKHFMDGLKSRSDSAEEGIMELEDKAEDIPTIHHGDKGMGNVREK